MKNLSLGKKLKYLRSHIYLIKLETLAKLYYLESNKKISAQAICLWENDKRVPSIENITIIANIYGISVDWLMNRGIDVYNEEIIETLETKFPLNELTELLYEIPNKYKNLTLRKQDYTLQDRALMLFSFRLSKFDSTLSEQFYNLYFTYKYRYS